MATLINTLSTSVHQIAQYNLNNQLTEYEKDGMQQLATGMLAQKRLAFLAAQLLSVFPKIPIQKISYIPLSAGILSGIASPMAQYYLNKPEMEQSPLLTAVSKLTVQTGKAGKFVCDHSNNLINTACCISYVSMIHFGFKSQGIAGLTGLFLIAVKRTGYIPKKADTLLENVNFIASGILIFTAPMFLPLRVLNILIYAYTLADHALKKQSLQQYLPKFLSNPAPGQHVVNPIDRISTALKNRIDNLAKSNRNFYVNISSINAPEVSKTMPNDFSEIIHQETAADLFNRLHQVIENENIELSSFEKLGLRKLKNGLVDGRVEGSPVHNMHTFEHHMKGLLHSILQDSSNRKQHIKEMASIGNQCIEGWYREIAYLLLPETKNVKWAVHHELAVLRGEMVKNALLEINNHICEEESSLDLSVLGGSNNVHILNATNMALWHRLRTYEGELLREIHGKSILDTLFINSYDNTDPETTNDFSLRESFFVGARFALAYPGPAPIIAGALPSIAMNVRSNYEYAVDTLVNHVYDAIRPQYSRIQNNDFSEESFRKISWESIQEWLRDIEERFEESGKIKILDENSLYGMNEKWVGRDLHNQYFLTKDGIRLLLWDLGVLTPVAE
jgi:hypothetical protein